MDPMQQLVQMRTMQAAPPPGPVGPGQGMGAPQLGAPVANEPYGPPMVSHTNSEVQNTLNEFAHASMGRGDLHALAAHLREIQGMFPKLLLADHKDGHAEMVGPAQEQFLAAAYARSKGAKTAHVRNMGRGQRLHLEF